MKILITLKCLDYLWSVYTYLSSLQINQRSLQEKMYIENNWLFSLTLKNTLLLFILKALFGPFIWIMYAVLISFTRWAQFDEYILQLWFDWHSVYLRLRLSYEKNKNNQIDSVSHLLSKWGLVSDLRALIWELKLFSATALGRREECIVLAVVTRCSVQLSRVVFSLQKPSC